MSNGSFVVEITEQNFNEVIQQSLQVPVLLDFWAAWCEPCKTMTPVLERLAERYQGKFILAKVNADEQPAITQQLRVRSLPALKLVAKGQLVGEIVGAQSEAKIIELLNKAIPDGAPPSVEDAVSALDAIVQQAKATGEYNLGVVALMEALEQQKDNNRLKSMLADLLIDADRIVDAKSVIDQMPADAKEINGPKARLQFFDAARALPTIEELNELLTVNSPNVEAHYQLGVRHCALGNFDQALDSFMRALTLDSSYGDEAARKSLVSLFDILGMGDERVKKARRQIFTLLH